VRPRAVLETAAAFILLIASDIERLQNFNNGFEIDRVSSIGESSINGDIKINQPKKYCTKSN